MPPQERDAGEDMTFVDCAYFASVVATTVGYGHRLVAHTTAAKVFFFFCV